jgi:hypothetical protein
MMLTLIALKLVECLISRWRWELFVQRALLIGKGFLRFVLVVGNKVGQILTGEKAWPCGVTRQNHRNKSFDIVD